MASKKGKHRPNRNATHSKAARTRRAQARAKARERTIRGRTLRKYLICHGWETAGARLAVWTKVCAKLVTCLVCCAYCAATAFGGTPAADSFTLLPPMSGFTIPPAMWQSAVLHDHMICSITQNWWTCNECATCDATRADRISLLQTHTPQYSRDILSIPYSELNYLSVVDVAVDIENKYLGFHSGSVFRRSLIDSPLVQTNLAFLAPTADQFAQAFCNVYMFNMKANPIYAGFQTLYERARSCIPTFPCVPPEAVTAFMKQIRERGIVYNSAQQYAMPQVQLGLVTDSMPLPIDYRTVDQPYIVGDVIYRTPQSFDSSIEAMAVHSDGQNALGNNHLSFEQAMFPFLFPHGRGSWKRHTGWELSRYILYRMSCMFSLFTLTKTYPIVMYALRQCDTTSRNVRLVQLECDIEQYRRQHPDASEDEIYTHVLKHCMPRHLSGTPSWYRQHLLDLLVYVEEFGMPHLFLTLTSDEVSTMRWAEIDQLEHLGRRMHPDFRFGDMPVECAALFHTRLWKFLTAHVILPNGGRGILGRVQHYVVRYEVQGRNSLHTHIVLWLHPDDVETVVSEICAYVPACFNPTTRFWDVPKDSFTKKVFFIVLKKQLHVCRADGCRARYGYCQYGFPFDPQPLHKPIYNASTRRYEYCRFDKHDRNVVPYHPMVLLLWNAHMNLQKITHESWSYYCLKYAMKAEPEGKLNLSTDFARRMNLKHVPEAVMKSYFATHMSRPISSTEIALHLLDLTTVYRSEKVHFISSQPPHMRLRQSPMRWSWNQTPGSSATHVYTRNIDEYMERPREAELENVTFYDYFKNYDVSTTRKKTYRLIGRDTFMNFVHELPEARQKLVRLSDFHPAHNPEGYFYNVLLQKFPFRREEELISADNNTGSYMHECYLRGILTDESSLLTHISDYTTRHLYQEEQQQALLFKMMSSALGTYLGSPEELKQDMPFPTSIRNMFAFESDSNNARYQANVISFAEEFESVLENVTLTADQQHVFNSILHDPVGMHVVKGVPGAGKTLVAKYIARHFETSGMNVVLCATTGAAASRLSRRATTAHVLFHIPATGGLPFLPPNNASFQRLLNADVIIVDEYSMLTSQFFGFILYRMQQVRSADAQSLSSKLIVFFGDPAQLPPVCDHNKKQEEEDRVMKVCPMCHVTTHPQWTNVKAHFLSASLRHAKDPDFVAFLNFIRTNVPTAEQLSAVFADMVLSPAGILNYLTDDCTVLTSHRADAAAYNDLILRQRFAQDKILQTSLDTNAVGVADMVAWLKEPHFHTLQYVAIGCRIMLTANLDIAIGAVNGATGTVTEIKHRGPDIYGIVILLDSGTKLTVYKLKLHTRRHEGVLYHKRAFPLALAYAITGHKAQGATIKGKVLIHVRDAFCPGLLYVMLSRVLTRSQIRFATPCHPCHFRPVPEQYLQ